MKKIIFLFLAIYSCTNCVTTDSEQVEIHATNVATGESIPQNILGAYFKLTNNRFDFGKIDGTKIPHIMVEAEFTNIGKAPLLILKGDVSCGCLSVEYPKEPILPNQNGKVIIHADLRAQNGTFNKAVFVKTNAENEVELIRIFGFVN